jgi:hypothetical protein
MKHELVELHHHLMNEPEKVELNDEQRAMLATLIDTHSKLHKREGGSADAESIPTNDPEFESAAQRALEQIRKNKAIHELQPKIEEGREANENRNRYDPYKGSDKPVETPKGNKGLSGGAGFTPGTMNPFNPDSPLNRKDGGPVNMRDGGDPDEYRVETSLGYNGASPNDNSVAMQNLKYSQSSPDPKNPETYASPKGIPVASGYFNGELIKNPYTQKTNGVKVSYTAPFKTGGKISIDEMRYALMRNKK